MSYVNTKGEAIGLLLNSKLWKHIDALNHTVIRTLYFPEILTLLSELHKTQ